MTLPSARLQIAELLRETGKAHHEAFAAVNGEDPAWARWYGAYLAEPLGRILRTELTEETLAADLEAVNAEHGATAPQADWPGYYADWFLRRYPGV